VGGLVLSNDGSIGAFPEDDQVVRLEPGRSVTFDDIFQAGTPLDVQEHVMVFGTQERNPVRWYLLASSASKRSDGGPPASSLERALDLYLQPGMRSNTKVSSTADTTWTVSTLPIRVEADRFARVQDPAAPKAREYTIRADIRPYLPDLRPPPYRVLSKADELARRSADGVLQAARRAARATPRTSGWASTARGDRPRHAGHLPLTAATATSARPAWWDPRAA
jgi:hypothetical protein